MENIEIRELKELSGSGLDVLVSESKQEDFRFLERLVQEYISGENRFQLPGEVLYGVFSDDGELLAVGGLNQDPFTKDQKMGRIRRFYVKNAYRRYGIGRLLVSRLIEDAKMNYDGLVLHTDTERADLFYQALGFKKTDQYPNSTHYLIL